MSQKEILDNSTEKCCYIHKEVAVLIIQSPNKKTPPILEILSFEELQEFKEFLSLDYCKDLDNESFIEYLCSILEGGKSSLEVVTYQEKNLGAQELHNLLVKVFPTEETIIEEEISYLMGEPPAE